MKAYFRSNQRNYVFKRRKRFLESWYGLRVLFHKTVGALMQKCHDEGVSTNLGRSIKMGRQRLEEEGERSVQPAKTRSQHGERHGRQRGTSPAIAKMALEAMREQTGSTGRKRGRWRTYHEQNRRQEQNEDGGQLGGAMASMTARVAARHSDLVR